MKKRSRMSRVFGAAFAAASLAVVALQGGVAQASDGVIDNADYVLWRDNLGTAGAASGDCDARLSNDGAGSPSDHPPELKHVPVRRY